MSETCAGVVWRSWLAAESKQSREVCKCDALEYAQIRNLVEGGAPTEGTSTASTSRAFPLSSKGAFAGVYFPGLHHPLFPAFAEITWTKACPPQ